MGSDHSAALAVSQNSNFFDVEAEGIGRSVEDKKIRYKTIFRVALPYACNAVHGAYVQ